MRFAFLSLAMIFATSSTLFAAPPKLAPLPEKITVATWNLEWFFDHNKNDNESDLAKEHAAPSAAEWAWRVKAVSDAIAKLQPTILCLQEIENRKVLADVVARLKADHRLNYEIAFVEGDDVATEQDVGIVWKSGLVEFSRFRATASQKADPTLYSISKHLAARFRWGSGKDQEELLVVTIHFRAGRDGAPFRVRQARQLWAFLDATRAASGNLIILGDTNTDHEFGKDESAGDIAVLRRTDNASNLDDLVDLHERLPADGRKTHLSGKQFDRILVTKALVEDGPKRDFVFRSVQVRKDVCVVGRADFSHGTKYWSIPQNERDISDHCPLVAEFEVK